MSENSSSGVWTKILDFSLKYLSPLFSFFALISGAFVSYDFSSLRSNYRNWSGLFDVLTSSLPIIFIISASAATILSFLMSMRRKTMCELEAEIDKSREQTLEISNNIKDLFDGLLLGLSKKLQFKPEEEFRISIYIHKEDESHFIICGRYSPNPELSKLGRSFYPDNEGCIAKGWQKGWYYDEGFKKTKGLHQKRCKKIYGINEETHEKLTMYPTMYAVKRFDDHSGKPLAVMVIETLNDYQLNEKSLKESLNDIGTDYSQIISVLKKYVRIP